MRESKNEKWIAENNWSSNPFTLEIKPRLLVGYSKQTDVLVSNLREQQKHIVLIGPTGAGKTTILKWISSKYNTIYLPKPPTKEDDIVVVFNDNVLKKTLFSRIISAIMKDSTNIYNLAEKVNKKQKGKQLVVLIDEAHETETHILEWLRTITDQIEGTTIIFAGLPKIRETHLKKLETLTQRIVADIELTTLTKDETVQLIKRRIESVGGRSIEPFTMDAINEIYRRTGGFPREIIKNCNSLVKKAQRKGAEIIDASFFEDEPVQDTITDIETSINFMTEKQKVIIDLLKSKGSLTPTQVVSAIDIKEYQSKAHALRAINNILRRLESTNLVVRERRGRTYTYVLSPKVKSILVKA